MKQECCENQTKLHVCFVVQSELNLSIGHNTVDEEELDEHAEESFPEKIELV